MSSKKASRFSGQRRDKHANVFPEEKAFPLRQSSDRKHLEIILKCDTTGCLEAIISAINSLVPNQVRIDIISSGVGSVSTSDIFMAETGSRLIVGFNVGLMLHVAELATEHNVEIRLYDVIYRLIEDLESICASLIPQEHVEQIFGTARVIALFKSSRKGIILGCEVTGGRLALKQSFRVLGTMGLKYVGVIESLHIENDAVKEATAGQRVGLKIRDFNKARIGDLVESFLTRSKKEIEPWHPQGKVFYP